VKRVLLLAAVVALAFPASALAHATLEGTSPQRGAVVKHEPKQVVFRFDEPVEGNFGAVRVYNSKAERVDQGDAFHPGGRGPLLGVHLKSGLPKGTYTATYRVVSADGHIVSSGFVFSIGKAGAAGGTVAQLLGKSKTGAPTEVAFGAARALQYGAIGLAGGLVAFLFLVWLPALRAVAGAGEEWRSASTAFVLRLRRVLLVVALVGVVSAFAGVVLEGASAAGVSGWTALRPHTLDEVLGTRFGTTWTGAAAAWLGIAVVVPGFLSARSRRGPVLQPASLGATGLAPAPANRALLAALVVPIGFLILLPALSGHGSTQKPTGVVFPANAIHVGAMSLWLGGLAALALVLPAATRELAPADRTRLLAGVVLRFSPIALGAVIALLAAALVQAYVEIRHPSLIFTTPFGRSAFIKFCLLLALIGLGALNRQRTLPALKAASEAGDTPGRAGLVLRRTIRGELALLVAALAVTGALASYAPSIAQVSGPYNTTKRIGPEELQMTVDPARVGSNAIHLYLTDPKSGAQYSRAKEVQVTAKESGKGIGPLDLHAQHSGPGHYTVPAATLNVPGTWVLRVVVRVSEFDEFTASAKVPVR
jgi:copper transport protein